MVDVPCLDHLWDSQKDPLDVGQVRCSQQETPRMTEFRQPIQAQSHVEIPGILVQLGRIQRT